MKPYTKWKQWHVTNISQVYTRRYNLMSTAIEIFIKDDGKTYFFNLYSEKSQQEIVKELKKLNATIEVVADPENHFLKAPYTKMWQEGKLSNFEYLMIVNTYAGRTYNDINQYPVFPWVVRDYTSKEIDFNANFTDEGLRKTFRRLHLPIGTYSKLKANDAKNKFKNWDNSSAEPAFHYESLYSNAENVTNFLCRLEPFTSLHIKLQNGQLDQSDKCFSSMAETWKSCLINKGDFRELVPELYYLPEALKS